jgi:hypothetical protein
VTALKEEYDLVQTYLAAALAPGVRWVLGKFDASADLSYGILYPG